MHMAPFLHIHLHLGGQYRVSNPSRCWEMWGNRDMHWNCKTLHKKKTYLRLNQTLIWSCVILNCLSVYLSICLCLCQGRFPAHYYQDEQGQGRLSGLDVNHSHFLLVDDGTSGKYGAEIELRGQLEKLISDQPLENSGEDTELFQTWWTAVFRPIFA